MAGGVGECQMRAGRQLLDAAHPLGEVLQQLKPMRMAQCLRHLGEILIDRMFGPGT